MPSWGVHLAIANKIIKQKNNISKNEFLFGSILPDLQDGYLVLDVSNITDHEENHYDLRNETKTYDNFYKIYKNKFDNPIILGYYTHLIADYYFNKHFEEKKIYNRKGEYIGYKNKHNETIKESEEEMLHNKHLDFKKLESYIYKTKIYKADIPIYNEKLSTQANIIKNININSEDVKKAIKYIKTCQNDAACESIEFYIFSIQELQNILEEVTKFCVNSLNEIEKRV